MSPTVLRARRTRWILVVAVSVMGFAGPSSAGNAPPLPPLSGEPGARKFDWVQVASGEWLKGEFDRVHDDKLYFDSDEFDDVTIDWADVASLLPVEPVTVRLARRKLVTGSLVMRNGEIRITTESGVVEFQRGDVIGIITGTGEELGYWSGSASVGLSARSGNTDQTDVNLRGDVQRQTSLTRFKASYTGQISTFDGDSTANSHRVPATLDVFLTDRLFLTTPSFEFFTDEFQNIGSRITLGAALGYEIVDNATVFWDVGGGASYQHTSFDSVEAGNTTADDAAVVFNTSVDLDLPRGVEWDNSYKIQIVATDIDKTNHHAESILSFDIWGPLELDLTFILDRVEKPVANASGDIPRSNDFRITMGLGIEL